MKSLGYVQSKNDYSLFLKKQNLKIIIVAVYVDDIIITGDNDEEIHFLKRHLDHVFTTKDLGDLYFFLGIEISYQDDGMILIQLKFTKELLAASKDKELKHVVTPLPLKTKLSASERTFLEDPTIYTEVW